MDKLETHTGIAAPLLRDNVDTDAIIPSREMKTVAKTGLADGLFAAWRYLDEKNRIQNPDFVLNHANYRQVSILLVGNNFGCGSSREHAVWALKEYGIRCIIGEGFGSIFFRNCVRNSILPIVLKRAAIDTLASLVEQNPKEHQLTIDLRKQTIRGAGDFHNQFKSEFEDKFESGFKVTKTDREMLLNGLDPIAVTQQLQDKIDAFNKQSKLDRPWL